MAISRNPIKSILILSGCFALFAGDIHADNTVAINIVAGTLRTAGGAAMPLSGLVILVASTTDANFNAPTASAFVSGDDIEIARWNLSSYNTAGILYDGVTGVSLSGNWNANDPVAMYWFPTLNINSTTPTNGAPYGVYRDAIGVDGSDAWFTPSPPNPLNLYFFTADQSGSNPNTAGYASQVVGNHPPVANPDGPYYRAPGLSLKIAITNLLANDTDADTNTLTFTGIVGNSTNNVSVTNNATYVLYPSNASNVTDRFSYTISDGQGGVSTGLVSVAVSTNVVGQAIAITNAPGSVTATFAGIPTYSYIVQRATDVNFTASVTNLVTTNAPAAGLFKWTDANPPVPTAYYRLRYIP